MGEADTSTTQSSGELVELREDSSATASPQVIDALFDGSLEVAQAILNKYSDDFHYENDSEDTLIYQYTNGAGLEGMIGSGKIWATATEYLNDSEELINGLSYTVEVCKAMSEKRSISERFRNFLTQLSSRSEIRGRYFVACFTENGDQLSQWRGYGDGGNGYSVGFSLTELVDNFDASQEEIGNLSFSGIYKVIYDQQTKIQAIEEYIEKYYEAVAEKIGDDELDKNLEHAVSFCFMSMHDIFSLIKHEAFAEEEEARASFMEFTDGRPKIRRRGNLFVPYYEIGANGQRLPIKEIIVGPTTDFSLTKRGIEVLLKQAGFDLEEVDIRPSGAPYRT